MSFYAHEIGLKLQPGAPQLDLSGWDPPRRAMALDISLLGADDAPALVLPAGLRELELVGGALGAAVCRWLMRARLPVLERVTLCKWKNLDLRPLLGGAAEAGAQVPSSGPLLLPVHLCILDSSSLSIQLPSHQPHMRSGRPLVLECGGEPGDGVAELILRPALPTVDVTAHMSTRQREWLLLASPPRVILPHATLDEWVQALTSFRPPRAARLAFTFLPPSAPPLFVASNGSASTVSELMQALEGAEFPTATYCSYDSSGAKVLQLDWQLPPPEMAA